MWRINFELRYKDKIAIQRAKSAGCDRYLIRFETSDESYIDISEMV